MNRFVLFILALSTGTVTSFDAQARDRARQLDEVTACRAISSSAERLACFDRTVGSFDDAEKRGDLVVANREQIRQDRREQFGLSTGESALVRRERNPEPVIETIESTLVASNQANYKWTFTLANGMRWRQTDSRTVIAPRTGAKVILKRAAMGGYFMQIGKDPSIRAVRIR